MSVYKNDGYESFRCSRPCSCMLLRTVGVLVTLGGIHLHMYYLSAITLVDFAFVLHVLTDLTLSFVYFTIWSFHFAFMLWCTTHSHLSKKLRSTPLRLT